MGSQLAAPTRIDSVVKTHVPVKRCFMYGRGFQDPDGHVWEVMWMDEAAVTGNEGGGAVGQNGVP